MSLIISKNFYYVKISNWTQQLKIISLSYQKYVKVTKTAGIDQISGNVLIDKVPTFAKPTIELCNLSMTLESFPDAYQIAM